MKVGYARVSSTGQNLESQIEALKKVGCTKIFQEKKSGKQQDNREELQNALDFVRDGDEFYVTRLDRCSRSVKDLHDIIDRLNDKGVSFKATEQDLDTSTSTGRLMIGLLSIVSAFETDLRAERQADGIKSALDRGVKFGRKRKLSDNKIKEIIELQQLGTLTNQQIADKYDVGRSTLLREVSNFKKAISSTKKYIHINSKLNTLDVKDSIYEKLISENQDEIKRQIKELIDSHNSSIYKDINFDEMKFELRITPTKVTVKLPAALENNQTLDKAMSFLNSVHHKEIDTSNFNYEAKELDDYDEFGFNEIKD